MISSFHNIKARRKVLEKVNRQILACKICQSRSVGMLVPGEGNATLPVFIVGEAPGKKEAQTGRPFIGRAGKVLRGLLEEIGINPENVFITSAVKYLPSYVTPKPVDIEHGKWHLEKQLEALKPEVVVVLGRYSALSVIGRSVSLSTEHGKIVLNKENRKCFVTYHPASVLYNPKLRPTLKKDFLTLKKILQKSI